MSTAQAPTATDQVSPPEHRQYVYPLHPDAYARALARAHAEAPERIRESRALDRLIRLGRSYARKGGTR